MSANERPMFSATEALRTRRTRTAGIGPLTLPRTVELTDLLIGAGGLLVGIMIGAIFGQTWEAMGWGAVVGIAVALLLAKFEPIKHHSLYKVIKLWLVSRRGRAIIHEGRRVRMAIGIAVIDEGPRGRFQLRAGAVEINPHNYDERGVPR